ncbi:hypothetical protein LTR01_008975, partial [Friedmanniomyces endolithicus]
MGSFLDDGDDSAKNEAHALERVAATALDHPGGRGTRAGTGAVCFTTDEDDEDNSGKSWQKLVAGLLQVAHARESMLLPSVPLPGLSG